MKKYLIAALLLVAPVGLEGCISTGVATLEDGKVVVSRNNFFGYEHPPSIYDCSSGVSCVKLK